LKGGLGTEEQPVSQLIRLAAQKLVQQAVEQEVGEFFERERYERRREGQQGLRNGYEPRRIRSADAPTPSRVSSTSAVVSSWSLPHFGKLANVGRTSECPTLNVPCSIGFVSNSSWIIRRLYLSRQPDLILLNLLPNLSHATAFTGVSGLDPAGRYKTCQGGGL